MFLKDENHLSVIGRCAIFSQVCERCAVIFQWNSRDGWILVTDVLLIGPASQALMQFQRAVSAQHPGWSVLLSADPGAALEKLQQRPVNVALVWEDDVARCEALLSKLGDICPGAVRLAIMADPAPVIRGAHQSLSSRSRHEDLLATLLSAVEVSQQISGQAQLQQIISRFHDVPSPPILYFEIREQLASASGNVASLADVAGRDPALVARTLKMANSGFYARPRSVGDLSEAIQLLGGETLLGLVLAAHLFSGLPPPGLRLDCLWQHTIEVATLARDISRIQSADRQQSSHAYVAGLLHDVGLLVLLQNESSRYQPIWRACGGDESELSERERAEFGVTHGELGALILKLWNMPPAVVQAVANSHASESDLNARQELTLVDRSVLAAEWLLDRNHLRAADDMPQILSDTPNSDWNRWFDARNQMLQAA